MVAQITNANKAKEVYKYIRPKTKVLGFCQYFCFKPLLSTVGLKNLS